MTALCFETEARHTCVYHLQIDHQLSNVLRLHIELVEFLEHVLTYIIVLV